jgi:hypothetical protein
MMSDALEDGEKAFQTNLQNMKATHGARQGSCRLIHAANC